MYDAGLVPNTIGILILTVLIIVLMRTILPSPNSTSEKLTIVIFSALAVLCTGVVCYVALAQGVLTAVSRAGVAVLTQTENRFWVVVGITYFMGVMFLSFGIAALWPRKE